MILEPTPIPGLLVIHLEPADDESGFFARYCCAGEFAARGLNPAVSQCSVSFNHKRGTRRGMHYQNGPAAEAKLVRVIRGSIFDVMADMRPESPALLRLLVSESRDTMGTGPDAACSAGSLKR